MANKDFTIRIESILGGISEYRNFAAKDEFMESLGIDPDLPEAVFVADASALGKNFKPSGYIRPVSLSQVNSTTVSAPMWMETTPKDQLLYVYDADGSVYTVDFPNSTFTGLTDLNDGGTASGNGLRYYDNYIYAARDTTIARYGPLDGTAVWTDDYWATTLSLTALVNTTYPTLVVGTVRLPNHILHRHNDGKLYITDVVGNQGFLHYIATTKTTVEGDTNDGSTYQKLDFPFGYWPTAIESYGTDLVIALYEGSNVAGYIQKPAKIAFWDTVAENYYKIIDIPDPLITAMKFDQVEGVLYIFSGQPGSFGTRISKFIGGYSFQQVKLIDDSEPPFPGAIDGILNKIFFGGTVRSVITTPSSTRNSIPCTWSLGSILSGLKKPLHNVASTIQGDIGEITSLKLVKQQGISYLRPLVGYYTGLNSGFIDSEDDSDTEILNAVNFDSVWRSQKYVIGQPFKLKKITFSVTSPPNDNTVISPNLYLDGADSDADIITFNDIDSAYNPNVTTQGKNKRIVLRSPNPILGYHDFFLELVFSGATTVVQSVKLPIIILGEYIDD